MVSQPKQIPICSPDRWTRFTIRFTVEIHLIVRNYPVIQKRISVITDVAASLNDLAELLKDMASRQDYHFPIVAAQRQFRERYYGLSSAAMLEDLYLDAVTHFVSTYHPDSHLQRPPRGEKGWDYALDDLQISHKVSKSGAPDIAVLWDATRTDLTHYTYGSPISLTTGGYSPGTIQVIGPEQCVVKARSIERDRPIHVGSTLLLVRWPEVDDGEVLFRWDASRSGPAQDVFQFRPIWAEVARASSRGVPANHLELLVVNGGAPELVPRSTVRLVSPCRAGTFLIPGTSLVDIPVKTNNRAVLIDKKIVSGLLISAVSKGLFIPMPVWFAAYAGDRPPDLYLAQKRNYDDSFSSS